MPDALAVTITIGATPSGNPDAINRTYEIVATVPGGYSSTSHVTANLHYLDSELTSSISPFHLNKEATMVTMDYDIGLGGFGTPDEHGRSAYDFTNNFIGMSNIPIDYFITVNGTHTWRTLFQLRDFINGYYTWNGSSSSVWGTSTNWTPVGVPSDVSHVIIPDAATTPNYPILPAGITLNSMTIENGGVLVMGNNTLTIKNLLSGGWEDQNPLGNDPGTSKVIFSMPGTTISGTARFYNVEIGNGADITNQAGSTMKIANTITKTGTGKWYADVFGATVEYNGGAQPVIHPDGSPDYHHLTLSGTGTKTMPSGLLTMHGNFTMAGTASATAAGNMEIGGNLNIGTGTTFETGAFTQQVKGDINCDGTFTATNGSSLTMNGSSAQSIGGTTATIAFKELTISNTSGVMLFNQTTTTTLNITTGALTVVAGNSLTASGITTLGTTECLVLKSDATGTASFIDNGTISGGGTAKVERYIASDFKWHFVSSPVASQPIWPEFAPAPTGDPLSFGSGPYNWDLYYFNPNCPAIGLYWVNLRKTDGTYNSATEWTVDSYAGFGATIPPTLEVGRGYLAEYNTGWSSGSPTTHSFTGTLITNQLSKSIVKSNSALNLVGNPYASSIDWKAASGWTRTDVNVNNGGFDYWIYNGTTGNYGVFNSTGADGSGTNGVSRNIAPGQAFFVQAKSASGSIVMDNNVRVHGSQSFLKDGQSENNLLRLKLSSTATTYSDEIIVEFNPAFSGEGSSKFWSMYSEAPELYAVKDGRNYSIKRYAEVTENLIVNISAKAGVDGNYTISAPGIADFTLSDIVYLEDLKTGNKINLKENTSYSFFGGPNDLRERFKLTFKNSTGIEDTESTKQVFVYSYGKDVYLNTNVPNIGICNFYIFDVMGRLVYNDNFLPELGNQKIISLSNTGAYIVKVISGTGISTAKIMIY